jgi:hypothetical protein
MALTAIDLFGSATTRESGGGSDQVNLIVSHLRRETAQHFRHVWG